MNPPNATALDALRDIHLPEAIGLWPLAPGWWLLGALLLGLFGGAILFQRRRQQRARSWQAASARELERLAAEFSTTGDAGALAAGLSTLLRRVALARPKAGGVAALHGDAWFTYWLADGAEDKDQERRTLQELTRTAYRGTADASADPETWIAFVRDSMAAAR